MPRLTKSQLIDVGNETRKSMYVRPSTVVGGFFPLAALAPFAAAAGIPLATSAGKWVGKKIFGTGVMRAGSGILRAGERMPFQLQGSGRHHEPFRAGDYPMPAMVPIKHYSSNYATGTSAGTIGGGKKKTTRKSTKKTTGKAAK